MISGLQNSSYFVFSALYAFTSHTFTTCGQTGPKGPSIESCRNYYTYAWAKHTNFFKMDINRAGVQQWTVPVTAAYRISACGAAGVHYSSTYRGGKGAKVEGTFVLGRGNILNLVCGQQGSRGGMASGGGGGTFVYTGDVGGDGLLIAAGGGGGFSRLTGSSGYEGQSGQYSLNSDGNSNDKINDNGGNGYGGLGGKYTSAGAGWKSVGGKMKDSAIGYPGKQWEGGTGDSYTAAGGFGGGGSSAGYHEGGGGGGGYTGGSGVSNDNPAWGGGGAGSYNGGENQINKSGYNDGNGYITITKA